MSGSTEIPLVGQKYREVFAASFTPSFGSWLTCGTGQEARAALGYRRAGEAPLFLECYIDQPIEDLVSARLGRGIPRQQIVELGNFAAADAWAMIELWGTAVNDLGAEGEVAVATLTATLRRMFARIGLPIAVLAPARAERAAQAGQDWGRYYDLDPQVCMGVIDEGQRAIAAFLSRRTREAA